MNNVPAQVEVGHFAALEVQGELHLVAFLEEVPGVVDLDLQIVVADADRVDVQFLQPAGARAGAGLVFFFLLLVAPFAVIHDSADGRTGGGSDLDEVQPGFAGQSQGFGGGNDADLFFFVVDQPDRRDPDLLVVAKIRRNGGLLQKTKVPLEQCHSAQPGRLRGRLKDSPVTSPVESTIILGMPSAFLQALFKLFIGSNAGTHALRLKFIDGDLSNVMFQRGDPHEAEPRPPAASSLATARAAASAGSIGRFSATIPITGG